MCVRIVCGSGLLHTEAGDTLTASPACFRMLEMVPSDTDSPMEGTFTSWASSAGSAACRRLTGCAPLAKWCAAAFVWSGAHASLPCCTQLWYLPSNATQYERDCAMRSP
jgi:hypothetical protein